MSRTLFIGDSHTMGYVETLDNSFKIWQSNNYAEIYARENNKQVVIAASSGCGNREYVNFLAYALKKYNDIDEVFIQSTYWGRFPIAINPTLNEKEILPLDFYMQDEESNDLIDRFSLGLVQRDNYMQIYLKPSAEDFDIEYIRNTSPSLQPSVRHSSYMYIKMYHYLQTHLEQQDYFKDIFMCDTLCHFKNIKLHLWNINERCFIPPETFNFYSDLKATIITDIDARAHLYSTLNVDIDNEKADLEHYNYNSHDLIAKHFIPYLRGKVL